MPVSHETVLFDVHGFAVWPLLSDPAIGGSPTYGPSVRVPGIQSVGFNPNFVGAEVKGDSRVIARRSKVDRIGLTTGHAKFSLDVHAVILGLAVQDTTVGSVDIASHTVNGYNPLPYFKAAFIIDETDVGVGSVVNILWKCMLTGGALTGGNTDQFHSPGLDLEAIPLYCNDAMWTPRIYDTVQPLSSAGV